MVTMISALRPSYQQLHHRINYCFAFYILCPAHPTTWGEWFVGCQHWIQLQGLIMVWSLPPNHSHVMKLQSLPERLWARRVHNDESTLSDSWSVWKMFTKVSQEWVRRAVCSGRSLNEELLLYIRGIKNRGQKCHVETDIRHNVTDERHTTRTH